MNYVLVQAAPGTNLQDLKARLNAIAHVDAYTKAEMSERTRTYWSSRTGVGAGFSPPQ